MAQTANGSHVEFHLKTVNRKSFKLAKINFTLKLTIYNKIDTFLVCIGKAQHNLSCNCTGTPQIIC